MNHRIVQISVSLVLLAVASLCLAETPVWKVSKNNSSVYIGGTIHMLSQQDYPLPSAFEKAYQNTEILIFETDIAALSQPETQEKLSTAFTFQDGRTLKGELNDETFTKLNAFLTERQIPIENFARFTPAGISIALTMLELQRIGITAAGVDQYFSQRAIQTSKQTNFLESVDDQVGFFKAFAKLDPNKLVNATLRDLASTETEWQQMLISWRKGDIDQLEEIAIDKMRDEFPSVYQFLLVERNNRWVTQIKLMFESKEAEFVLVGALHLAGDDSVLGQLADDGYSIEQLKNY